jgi:acyl-CoA synthetase (AMP-forming)/AMP-acid ligase II
MISHGPGFHSEELKEKIKRAWESEELLVVYPPGYVPENSAFLEFLPDGKKSPQYPEKPILGIFTSGTVSGERKLVLYSKKNIEFSLNRIRSFFDPQRFDTIFCYPQPFHTFGIILGYLHAELYGLKLVTPDGKYTRDAHERRLSLKENSVLTLGTPAHFHDLIHHLADRGQKLTPSYSCILGGAKVPVALWKSVQSELSIEKPSIGYGATEASPGITHQAPGLCPSEEGEIGSLIPGVSLELGVGRGIRFEGPNVCLAIVTTGPYPEIRFPTSITLSDSIRLRSDGIYIYEGRSDLMINRGGTKFSLELIENTIRSQKDVEAICVPITDERLGEELGILLKKPAQPSTDFSIRKAELYAFLQSHFGHGFDPRRCLEIEELPLNESFKNDRQQAREILLGSQWTFDSP